MPADIFGWKHKNIESRCMIGVPPGLLSSIYKHSPEDKTRGSPEITERDQPRYFRFSSSEEAVDTDGEVAGFFLPQLDSRSAPMEKFLTIGVH